MYLLHLRPLFVELPIFFPGALGLVEPRGRVGGATNAMISKGITAKISIHAPRVGRDGDCVRSTLDRTRISIHAPRVGRDQRLWHYMG